MREGFTWTGVHAIERKAEWPDWLPPSEMISRQPYLPRFEPCVEWGDAHGRPLLIRPRAPEQSISCLRCRTCIAGWRDRCRSHRTLKLERYGERSQPPPSTGMSRCKSPMKARPTFLRSPAGGPIADGSMWSKTCLSRLSPHIGVKDELTAECQTSSHNESLASRRDRATHLKIVVVALIATTNTTIAAKNLDLPEVTVRDPDAVAVRPVPVEASPRAERPRLPVGCDPSFGPLADPSLRGLTGRCLTSTASVQTFAALR